MDDIRFKPTNKRNRTLGGLANIAREAMELDPTSQQFLDQGIEVNSTAARRIL